MTDLADVAEGLSETMERVTEGSPLDRIRRKRAELERGKLLDIPIPGYGGELVARYRRLTPEQLDEAGRIAIETVGKSIDAQLTAAAKIVTLYVHEVCAVASDGRHVALDPDDPEPLRFDDRLARLMGLSLPPNWNGRTVLVACMTRGNEAGIQMMARRLLEWSSGMTEEVRETLEGESEATLP